MAPVPGGEFQPMVVRDLRAVAVVNGRASRMVEALVAFSERSITATDTRNGFVVKSLPYGIVTHTTVSRSRKPRSTGGVTFDTPGGTPQGNVFARGPRVWVTIETADDRLVLVPGPQQLRMLVDLLAQRTKGAIERYMEPEQ